ncbi:MAG: hypothetical protein ACXADD_02015 [Candidatus Thorarchaeota archaeon]
MPQGSRVVIPIVVLMLLCMPFMVPSGTPSSFSNSYDSSSNDMIPTVPPYSLSDIEAHTGVFDPVDIWHTGAAHGITQYQSGRTDVESNPSTEVWLPAGAPVSHYSADCFGSSFFLIGPGGSTDFSSPSGTLSWWGKWDDAAPHGRWWGQHGNFELRWSSGQIVLDWGTDTALTGTKSDWVPDQWYFFAIAWNETSDFLAFYWGDELNMPQLDASITWTSSVVGLHVQNDIMNSMQRTAYVDGHVDEFRCHYYMFENDLSDTAGGIDLIASGSYAFSPDVISLAEGWKAEQLQINVNNLRNLYALNGSFDSGFPGVNEDWSGDGVYNASGWLAQREVLNFYGRQRATYDATGYVILENEGWYNATTSSYQHYNGTRIFWYQNVTNSRLDELFEFDMNYLYQNGPIGYNFTDIFRLKFEILDGSILLWNWSTDLVNTTQRQVWYSTGVIPVNITGAPSAFQVRVVLEVTNQSVYISIPDTDPDLDGSSTNGQLVSVIIDDISLKGAILPSCESANLTVSNAQTGSRGITGLAGSGSTFLNYDSWSLASIPISFSSNSSVSFDYSAKVSKMKRFHYSLSTSSLDEEGVAFTVESGESVNLTIFTYVASYPEAEELGLLVFHPNSWENVSIEDPFGDEYLGPIANETDYFEIPAGVIDSVGWWIARMQGPNYAKEIRTQKFLTSGPGWIDEAVFRSGDRIRCQVTVATASDYPPQVMNLESVIYLPSDEFWATAFMNNMTGFVLTSDTFTFGSYNATIGEWMVTAFWNNGSAVAYGHVHFDVYHQLTMFAHTPSIERNLGENFTAAVYIHDQETGEPILDGAAVVLGNWSYGPASFSPNLAKGWWEADFNTSQIGVGLWVMRINASIPYYENANCTIDIQVMTLTVMTTLGNYFVEISPGGAYVAKFRYMFLDGSGISGASVFVATWSGPAQGIDYNATVPVVGEPGNYTIEFTGNLGGTYFITVTGIKEDHSTAATSFYLIVGAISTDIEVSGEELPDELYYNQTYTCTLFYSDGNSLGIEGASVNITYNPVAIVDWVDNGGGFYQFSFRVPSVGSYAIYARIQQFGYAYADASFIFDVIEVPTSISDHGISESYYDSRIYEFALFYNSTLENGVSGATLTPSISIRSFFRLIASGNGWYNFSLTPASGDYNATLWLSKTGYQEQEFSFRFSVARIPVILSPIYPINQTYSERAGSFLNITISPIAADTGEALRGAAVDYVVEPADGNRNNLELSGSFVEFLGVYTAIIKVPDPGLYVLRITIRKNSHQDVQHEIVLSSEADPGIVLANYVQAGIIGALSLLGIITVTMITRRFYQTTTTKRNLELLLLKGRLEDSKNLIGLLIIHRKVGLPVYSRFIKGGFEESMISSFIAAISQFRAEFSWDEPIWAAIPITEVITAVQTEVLICAIITLEGASVKQKGQLEAFGREIGGLYDHEDDTLRAMFHTPELSEAFARTFDPIFDSYFDGALTIRYVGVKKSLPTDLKPVSEAMSTLSIDYGVTPDAIIKALVMLGYNERLAHRMTLEAIDSGYLIASERGLPSPTSDDTL